MTPELQKYYDDRFDLFSKPGWIDLMEDVDNVINSINNVSNVQDEKDLQFKKGELSILEFMDLSVKTDTRLTDLSVMR